MRKFDHIDDSVRRSVKSGNVRDKKREKVEGSEEGDGKTV